MFDFGVANWGVIGLNNTEKRKNNLCIFQHKFAFKEFLVSATCIAQIPHRGICPTNQSLYIYIYIAL